MIRGFWAMTIKEFRQLRRDPVSIIITILIPSLQLAILGYAIRTDVRNVPLVVVDLSRSEESRTLLTTITNTGVFRLVGSAPSYGSAYDAIRNGRAKAGILIPPDFAEARGVGQGSAFQVLVDGSDPTTANYVVSAVDGAAGSLAHRESTVLEQGVPEISASPRILFNPELRSSTYFVPALIILILHLPLLILTSLSIVRERVEGTLEQLIATPIGRLGLMLGKLTPFLIIGALAGAGILTVMVYLFQVPIAGSLIALLFVMLIWILTSLALGLMVSTMARTQLQAVLISILLVVPSILLSGFMFPRESMPAPVYPITLILPMTYAIYVVRGLVIRGAPLSALTGPVAILVGFCILMVTVATFRFQKRLG